MLFRSYKVDTFLIRITRCVDLAMSVCLCELWISETMRARELGLQVYIL